MVSRTESEQRERNSPVTGSQPVVLKRNTSGQENWLRREIIYAVKPGVPNEDERIEHKENMRVDDDKLTATLVTTRGYIIEGRCEGWRINLSTNNKHISHLVPRCYIKNIPMD